MRKYGKKILGIVAAATMLCSMVMAAGCDKVDFKMPAPNQADYAGEVKSNGGFAVEKGNYVYFINGVASNTDDNTYGKVEKGALMRITKAQLAANEYHKAEILVPSLFVSKNMDAGLFVHGDYLYYATPTTDTNMEGVVENSYVDFKRIKLDGSEKPMEDKFFHALDSVSLEYRFVKEGETVYCLYEEDGALKSYNTDSKKTVVLVKGANDYFYDRKDVNNANVYYTMSVTYDIATDIAKQSTDYNQLYCVNAAATVKEGEVGKETEGKISYTVEGKEADKDGTYSKTYTFNADFLKDEEKSPNFDAKDYTTYPYVNLGQLVLDGVGKNKADFDAGWFNEDSKADALDFKGYNYTVARYENGGVYFTRSTDSKLYFLSDKRGADWNTIKANDVASAELDVVALNQTNASASALFFLSEAEGVRTHSYLYTANNAIYTATADVEGKATNEFAIAQNLTSPTLWKMDEGFVYFYSASGNGNNLSRVKYTTEKGKYNALLKDEAGYEDYQPITIALVEWNNAWYKPELIKVGENKSVVLYSNVQKYGNSTSTFGYVYAAQIGTTAEIKANNDKLEAYNEYLNKYNSTANAQNLIKYFFSAGTLLDSEATKLSQEVIDLYKDESKAEKEQDAFYKEVVAKFTAEEGKTAELITENKLIGLVGKVTDADQEAIETAWKDSLLKPETEAEEEKSLPGWAIALIVVGAVLVVAAGVSVPVVFYSKKKVAAKKEAEATINAYRRKKIDTTDDKTIDVYADEKQEDVAEESTAEEASEEASEAVEETEEVAPETEAETVETEEPTQAE